MFPAPPLSDLSHGFPAARHKAAVMHAPKMNDTIAKVKMYKKGKVEKPFSTLYSFSSYYICSIPQEHTNFK